jgi:hypothetical protein
MPPKPQTTRKAATINSNNNGIKLLIFRWVLREPAIGVTTVAEAYIYFEIIMFQTMF